MKKGQVKEENDLINEKNEIKDNSEIKDNNENTQNIEKTESPKKNKVVHVLSNIVETIIWIGVIFFLSLLVFTTLSNKTEVFGYRIYVIVSGSMEPVIKINQAVITKHTDNVQVGDIIAFSDGNQVTVHRVVKIYNDGNEKLYETKGDANNTVDKTLIKDSMIKGKVKYIIPGIGSAILFLQGHLMVLIFAISLLIIVIIVRRVIYNE